jgi:citrate lyase subunit beta/citryl-CoA lyase
MRSKLFVPGSRPDLFEKAWQSEADAVSFDLEDAVITNAKAEARKHVAARVRSAPPERRKFIIVRINPFASDEFEADLDAVIQPGLDIINLPKVEDAETVRRVDQLLDKMESFRGLVRRIGILVNIETPRALRRAFEIATSSTRIIGLQLGFGDLFSPLGIERSPGSQEPVRLAVRFAAGEAGLAAYDGAFVDVSDLAGFRAEAEAARAMGFAGKTCVHPSQTPIANSVFFPRAAEIEMAKRVVAKADEMTAQGVGAFTVDGVMFDGPLIARAREIVRLVDGRAS